MYMPQMVCQAQRVFNEALRRVNWRGSVAASALSAGFVGPLDRRLWKLQLNNFNHYLTVRPVLVHQGVGFTEHFETKTRPELKRKLA